MQSNMKTMQDNMEIMQGEIRTIQNDIKELREETKAKFKQIDIKLDELDTNFINLKEEVNIINRTVAKIELSYGKKIDIIYENTVSFLEANYKNTKAIEKLEKRVEKLECIIPIEPQKHKEAII